MASFSFDWSVLVILADGFFSFFKSGTWDVIRNLAIFFAVIFWLAVAVWVYKDARRRIEDPWLVAMATMLGLIPPFFGALIYLLLRPPEYLEEVRERELEIKAMEERLSRRDLHCPVCRAQVEATYLVCPVCTTKLKQSCVKCRAPLEALWQMCPYCETPIETPSALELGRTERIERMERLERAERESASTRRTRRRAE